MPQAIFDTDEQVEEAKRKFIELGPGGASFYFNVAYETMRKFGVKHHLESTFEQDNRAHTVWSLEEVEWLRQEVERGAPTNEEGCRALSIRMARQFGDYGRTPVAIKARLSIMGLAKSRREEREETCYQPFLTVEERDAFFDAEGEDEEFFYNQRLIREFFQGLKQRIDDRFCACLEKVTK